MLKIHEIAAIWPEKNAEELQALEDDIRAQGLLEPIKFIVVDGERQLIDGRYRQMIVQKLLDEGLHRADNGALIQMDYQQYDGSLLDAELYVEGIQGRARRHMSVSQMVAAGWLSEKLKAKYRQMDGELPEDEDGDKAEKFVRKWGGNRSYYYDLQRLDTQPDIFERVRAGEISIVEAVQLFKVRHEPPPSLHDYQSDDESPFQAETPDGSDEPRNVVDGLRNPVDALMKPIFAARPEFKACRKAIQGIISQAKKLASGEAGKFLANELDELKSSMEHWARVLDATMPHACCPICEMQGEIAGTKCHVCGGHGYVSKALWKNVPAEYKTKGTVED